MTKIDIISGFLGAGKTTLIKKLIQEAYVGEKIVLIENEFGEIGIDGGFLQDSGVMINEMNSGCICCSLVGDFGRAMEQVLTEMKPDRIIIEPSGVGKLSDVIRAAREVSASEVTLSAYTTVADVNKCKMYMKNFGEFYNDQIANATCIVLSHVGVAKPGRVEESVELIRAKNPQAVIVTTDWNLLSGAELLAAMEGKDSLQNQLSALEAEMHHHHEHHHHDHGEECTCGCHEHHHEHHHRDHDEECECGCHEHHHHDHDEECHCGCHEHHHEHHHDHDEECTCGCHEHHNEHHHHEHGEECECGCHGHHDHGHHHHHHADEVFSSIGCETTKTFTQAEVEEILGHFDTDCETYGTILRAKGIVEGTEGTWLHFDYVPGEVNVRVGAPGVIGRICVIGTQLCEDSIRGLFGV